MLVQESSMQGVQSASISSEVAPKCKICTLNCTLEEIAVLNFLRELPKATQKEIESDNEDTAAPDATVSSLLCVLVSMNPDALRKGVFILPPRRWGLPSCCGTRAAHRRPPQICRGAC